MDYLRTVHQMESISSVPWSEMMGPLEGMQDEGAAVHFKETYQNWSNKLRKPMGRTSRAEAPAEIRTGGLLNKRYKCTRSSKTQQISGKKNTIALFLGKRL
jgi:hypothetical protein